MLLNVREGCRLGGLFASRKLMSDAARARLDRIAAILPRSYSSGTFEVRLDGAAQVDYQICFTARSGGRAALAQWLADLDLATVDPAWRRSLEFLRFWSTPGSRVHDHAPAAWLELDCRLDDPAPPVPFPFFSLPPPWEDVRLPRDEAWATLVEGWDRLAAAPASAAERRTLRRMLDALPPSGCVIHTALRPVGRSHVTRLILRMPVTEIASYLTRTGWPHPTTPFAAFVDRFCAAKIGHSVQLDVREDGIGPRIGLEFFYDAGPRDDPRWRALFDRLVAEGACTPERRAQVEAWVGVPRAERFELLLRGLLVKVVYRPGSTLEAKAYLPFCVNPLLDSLPRTGRVDPDPTLGTDDTERAHAVGGVGADRPALVPTE
ncbi:MAG: hypothetical protein ABIR79_12305 [Candidatus Binatia bacterium]